MVKEEILTETDKVIKIMNMYLENHNWHSKYNKKEFELECEVCRKLVDELVITLVH